MSRSERAAVYAVVFLSGALLMSLEVAAFRIIGKTFGSALRETTAVIAVFLAAMSIGYWAGGRAGDRWPRPGTIVAALLGAALSLLAVPWVDALLSPRIADSSLSLATHAFVATTVLFALPTVLFAAVSPIAIRLFTRSTGSSGSTAGSISAVSTAGSIAGSVLTAFVLIDLLESIARTVLTVSLAACVTAVILLLATIPRMRGEASMRAGYRSSMIALFLAVVIGVPALVFIRSTRVEQDLLTPLPDWRVLYVGDSPYHRVTVRERQGMLRLLTFGTGSQSLMRVGDPLGPGTAYSDSAHLSRLMRPSVRRVLVLGLGGGTIPKQFVHYYPDTVVDVVEVDPVVVNVAKTYFGVQTSERLRVHVMDARLFLKRTTDRWDLIVIDVYTTNRYGNTIPPHLVTQEFFREAAARLNPGGIVHFHCAFGGTKLLAAIQKTMGSVFANAYVTGGEILGSDVALITPKETVLARLRESPAARLPNLVGYIEDMKPYAGVSGDIPLLTDDYAPVDTLR